MTVNTCFQYGKENLAQCIFMTWGMVFSEELFKKGKSLGGETLNVGIQLFTKFLVKKVKKKIQGPG